jgi:SAM-dependent methyltransferase
MAINRRKWDESVPLHVASRSYDVPAFRSGRTTLERVEIAEMGSVRGRTLLHLQCHFGLDTLSWARRGARVTGVDYSLPAVRAARRLAREVEIPARFLHSNVYDLPGRLDEEFDIVYTGKGAICWMPDLTRWARIVADRVRPGGRFYLLDDHPIADTCPNDASATHLELRPDYFRRRPFRDVTDGTYAAREVRMRYRVSYSWVHPVGTVLTALARAGLTITSVHEFPFSYWYKFPFMRRGRDGYWHLTSQEGALPLMWSIQARKPARSDRLDLPA